MLHGHLLLDQPMDPRESLLNEPHVRSWILFAPFDPAHCASWPVQMLPLRIEENRGAARVAAALAVHRADRVATLAPIVSFTTAARQSKLLFEVPTSACGSFYERFETTGCLIATSVRLAGFSATAPAAPVVTECGSLEKSIVRTEKESALISSATFTPVPGATVVVSVPSGQTRCIRVTFSAFADCGNNYCYIRSVSNSAAMYPNVSEDESAFAQGTNVTEAHSFTFVARVGSGNRTIVVRDEPTMAALP